MANELSFGTHDLEGHSSRISETCLNAERGLRLEGGCSIGSSELHFAAFGSCQKVARKVHRLERNTACAASILSGAGALSRLAQGMQNLEGTVLHVHGPIDG